jgi:hypothetical protein
MPQIGKFECSSHAFALQTGDFLWHDFGGMASRIVKAQAQTSASKISRFHGIFLA